MLTFLREREGFRRAFDDFDFERVARFTPKNIERLLGDAAIVRHRGKIEANVMLSCHCRIGRAC